MQFRKPNKPEFFSGICAIVVVTMIYTISQVQRYQRLGLDTGIGGICKCSPRSVTNPAQGSTEQWCSPESNARGLKQRVVSYSLFGDSSKRGISERYFQLLGSLAENIQKHYSGWIMRVYHNFTQDDPLTLNRLCQVYCSHHHVDLCNISMIQRDPEMEILTNNTGWQRLNPRMWRFLAAVDPSVDYFASRDVDAMVLERETAAVQQWIDSNYTFHVMRDHPYHNFIILAGMWGAKLFQKRSVIRDIIFQMVHHGIDQAHFTDQLLLRKIFWPVAKHDVMAHDSYFCLAGFMLQQSVVTIFPFPTQRNQWRDYVGNIKTVGLRSKIGPCPEKCRPPAHREWIYC